MKREIIKAGNKYLKVDLSEDNVKIYKSYKLVKTEDIKAFLEKLIKKHSEDGFVITKRSLKSMIYEWKGHNLLFYLHLFRSHTTDVDLEYPQKWYMKAMWFCLGVIYFK